MAQTNGKVVMVTGGSRGLGRGVARQFGRLGATVDVTSRPSSEAMLREAAAEVTAWGGWGIAVSVDQRDAAQVEALVQRVCEEISRLDILVNNAAAVYPALAQPGVFWEKPLAFMAPPMVRPSLAPTR